MHTTAYQSTLCYAYYDWSTVSLKLQHRSSPLPVDAYVSGSLALPWLFIRRGLVLVGRACAVVWRVVDHDVMC